MIPIAQPCLGEEELNNALEATKPGWIISNVMFALHLPPEASETRRAKAQNPTQLPDEYLPSINPFPLALSNPWK
jgi:hypothetical protein